ncbi:MAG: methyltransferase domain-containing protein, partial [Planctomycetota bacterium]
MRQPLLHAICTLARPTLAASTAERVAIWGAGEVGVWLAQELDGRAVAFLDSNPAKRGARIAGRPVVDPEQLDALDADEVWIAVLSDAQAILDQLEQRGWGARSRVPFEGGKRLQVLDQLDSTLAFIDPAEVRGRAVLEVGFGGNLYLACLLAHLGARSIRVCDVEPQASSLGARRREWLGFLEALDQRLGSSGATAAERLARIAIHPEPTSAGDLTFEPDSFDLVANTGVMEHVDDPSRAIAEFARVLRPGGTALCLAIGIHDHRANDPRSGFHPWSFLEHSDAQWRALGESTYAQNRWRAVDFRRAFEATG